MTTDFQSHRSYLQDLAGEPLIHVTLDLDDTLAVHALDLDGPGISWIRAKFARRTCLPVTGETSVRLSMSSTFAREGSSSLTRMS